MYQPRTRRGGFFVGNRTNLTPKKRATFCKLLAETGNVTKSAQAIGVSRTCCYAHKDEDPVFKVAWDNAVNEAVDALEEEGRRRAFEGTLEPVFYQGVECGYVRKYSDTLLIFLMKGHRPETYRERFQVQHEGELTIYDGKDKSAKSELESILSRRLSRISPQAMVKGDNGN